MCSLGDDIRSQFRAATPPRSRALTMSLRALRMPAVTPAISSVDIIDLCSKNSRALLTPVAIDNLMARVAAGKRYEPERAQVQKLGSRLGGEACDQICARYAASESATSIAVDYNVSKNSVLNLVRSRNIVVRVRQTSDEQIDRAVELYKSGMPIAKIQVEVGSSYGAIRRALLKNGVQLRPRGFQPGNHVGKRGQVVSN